MIPKHLVNFLISFFIVFIVFISSTKLCIAQVNFPGELTVSNTPQLHIVSPGENENILGQKIKISVITKNFIFVDSRKITPVINPINSGHLHLWLDEEVKAVSNAKEIFQATDITIENVSPGEHILTMEFVNNSHQSFNPPVSAMIHFTTFINDKPISPTEVNNQNYTRNNSGNFIKIAVFITGVTLFLSIIVLLIIIFKNKKSK